MLIVHQSSFFEWLQGSVQYDNAHLHFVFLQVVEHQHRVVVVAKARQPLINDTAPQKAHKVHEVLKCMVWYDV